MLIIEKLRRAYWRARGTEGHVPNCRQLVMSERGAVCDPYCPVLRIERREHLATHTHGFTAGVTPTRGAP